ncbi:hypothetical protein FNO01nite_13800 [Flavobacterium noncentrifugens]|uniref:Maltose O-acetyltransferase n=1 Tax=Flavobacterium noncentrifugens TaxID=1128970 RepID=A0A1G8VZY7_9FLAO|nr:DapH/DapD/GlmU-related protein [Flavobacterium noncentrifugens]GEP50708.1 hypothetical protein FNO01nite_13800 [Flavobacterium noncentrifugens]SDJ71456.1 maltose O-acetyltransferase [Flavobacterium noncentrifugens]
MGLGTKIKQFLFVTLRIRKYQWLSDCKKVSGKPNYHHPCLLAGKGRIVFGQQVQMGVIYSPNYYSNYSFIEAREENSEIKIGDHVAINNNFSAVAFSKITISDFTVIGINCSIMDSDGHHLDPAKRSAEGSESVAVYIGKNVFLGDNVTILKGVTIGDNSVIGIGSVVTKSIPENVVAAGNPARVIRNL